MAAPITVTVTITATPADDDPFTEQDLRDAIEARLDEMYPTDGQPVIPTVSFVD